MTAGAALGLFVAVVAAVVLVGIALASAPKNDDIEDDRQ